jgi:hypothetical protein
MSRPGFTVYWFLSNSRRQCYLSSKMLRNAILSPPCSWQPGTSYPFGLWTDQTISGQLGIFKLRSQPPANQRDDRIFSLQLSFFSHAPAKLSILFSYSFIVTLQPYAFEAGNIQVDITALVSQPHSSFILFVSFISMSLLPQNSI